MILEKIVMIYLILVNFAGILVMGMDKARAKARAWRISEKTLFGIALLGGSAGTWAGMYIFRHKTKHWDFKFGMPLILFVQIIGVSYVLQWL